MRLPRVGQDHVAGYGLNGPNFGREVGITPHAYLVQRRVRLTRRLLADGQTPVQAAIQAGFADQSHMTRAFLRQVGITPSRYRAAIG